MSSRKFPWHIVGIGLVLMIFSAHTSRAQISPGDLHRSHAGLEGIQNCTKCHGSDRELASEKCLVCHSAIKAELSDKVGYHGRQSNQCQTCHVEHQGRDFKLIYWKDGQKSFDHAQTGWSLDGKHLGLECRKCHIRRFVVDSASLTADKRNLDSTLMGLRRVCSSCHIDEHRGQFTKACTDCHSTGGWKPATGFDHATSKFALSGKHTSVLCEKCHSPVVDRRSPEDSSFAKFVGLKFASCTDCHADVHKGKLGDNCQNCHSTSGWNVTDKGKFDHSKTRYPLEGKHFSVGCDKCHLPGKGRQPLRFAACRDCHSDFHKGEFAHRPGKGNCEECHTVVGFEQSRFLVAQHDSSKYPLRGAHRAVACSDCHKTTATATVPTSFKFRWKSTRCLDCHPDPHRGEVKKIVDNDGCEFCHVVDTWRTISFDHKATKFALDGKHAKAACRKCHTGRSVKTGSELLTMVGARTECWACHADVHRNQFAKGDPAVTECASCHSPENWKASRFDHSQSSRFKLDGAHKNVPCVQCHKSSLIDGAPFIAYKPLDTTCVSCHGGIIPPIKEKTL